MDKLLIFTTDFEPLASGVARYYFNLAAASQHSNIPWNVGMLIEVVAVDKKYSWWLWPKWLPYFWRLKKSAEDTNVKFIGVGQILPLGLPLLYLAKKFHKKIIIFTHGLDVANLSGRRKSLAQYIFSHSNLIICNSEFTQNIINLKFKIYNLKFLTLTPCPAQLPEPESDFRLTPPDQPYIFSYGRLVARKGFVDLALALKTLWQKGEKFYWFLAGSGPELENIKKALGDYHDNLIYIGKVSDQMISNYLFRCAFFAMTPRNDPKDPEGFGMVYLEAGSLGRAVLGTRAGGIPEAVKDGQTGLLAEAGNISDIADKTLKMLKNPELCAELGKKGQNMVKTEYSWSNRAKLLSEALTRLY